MQTSLLSDEYVSGLVLVATFIINICRPFVQAWKQAWARS